MSNLNHFSAANLDHLSIAEHHDRPELQQLLDALRLILGGLQARELPGFKRVRRAVRAKVAYGMTGDGKSQFWARQNPNDPAWDPTFPASFKLGNSARSSTVWFEDEIEAWLESRANASRELVQAMPKAARGKPALRKAAVDAGVMQ